MNHSFGSPSMAASNIPLNHSMYFSNRWHPTKPYHKTIKIPFNYGHISGCLHDMRLSRRREFTPVPSHGSTFLYMIKPQNVMRCESSRREFTPVVVPGREFHSGTKSRNSIM